MQIGDKVIYIGGCKDTYIDSILEVGKVYTISKIFGNPLKGISDLYLYFDWERKKSDNGFPLVYFKELTQIRKERLLKIKNRIKYESK